MDTCGQHTTSTLLSIAPRAISIKSSLDALGARRTDEVVPRLGSGVKQVVKWNDTALWSSSFDRSYEALARDAAEVRIGGAAGRLITRADLAAAKCEPPRTR